MSKDSIKPLKDLLENIRDIDGFPVASDEEIIRLSDAPFYTACPNPYLKDLFEVSLDEIDETYNKLPFVSDVEEGKNGPIYNAHSYHTKVPYKAIVKFINHYTKEGDVVFDGFCGSGMTGVAAKMCNRNAILNDISPSATLIAYNYCNSQKYQEFNNKIIEILKEVEKECGWMYKTQHNKIGIDGKLIIGFIDNTIWSDVFYCPECSNELIFWDIAVDVRNKKIKKNYQCNNCETDVKKKDLKKKFERIFDDSLNCEVEILKQVPVLINYTVGKKRFVKTPDENDLTILKEISTNNIPYWYPSNEFPIGYNTKQPKKSHNITHVHQIYSKRNLWILSSLFEKLIRQPNKNHLYFLFTSIIQRASLLNRFRFHGTGGLSGTLYIPSLRFERNPILLSKTKLRQIISNYKNQIKNESKLVITTQSTTNLKNIPSNSIDYIFVDPPFGQNLMYSELNFLWESWLKVFTNNISEAIINKVHKKDLIIYKDLMFKSFKEMYKILKSNRWITIEFHNSEASVWNAIQESISRAGFVIAQVTTLDKKQGSFKQVTSIGAVKMDLIINAYKPKKDFSDRFLKNAGHNMELDFIKEHIRHIPVLPNTERTENMLYSKMLAFYVEKGYKIKYNAKNFFQLLSENFIEIDGYWFLDDEVKKYNEWKSRLNLEQIKTILDGQQIIFINDEKSALNWLNNFIYTPREYSKIYTAFNQAVTKMTDNIPELRVLLDRNFILEKEKYRRPRGIQEIQNIKQNREKILLKTFDEILRSAREDKGKISIIRKEALIYGFTQRYQIGQFQDILSIASKLDKNLIESNTAIRDFIDVAKIKTEGISK
ncbi:hypothetical protein LCGC14_1356060 [marine sediment metagenome]|uniref:DNA methylase N-4/N-6 domain-containing protein n=1 Tax=marine sediment metagenome TaxID=412755 RepID=A0A0F9KA72_9ZZZZ